MHGLVDHAQRLVCSQNLKRRNFKLIQSQVPPTQDSVDKPVVSRLSLLERSKKVA